MRIPTVQPGILAPSPVVARPSSSTQLLSPTSSRSKGRRQRTVSPAPRPISGPLLIPTDDAMDVDMGFDLERASRQLRNQPGRVCFDEVALFPPDYDETESADADADGEDEDDARDGSRKRPRMASRRWSLW
ncbi:uncharacterized protein EHS24_008049 [Apiotrichum porosum]|uniref:Uncharacterized protein n=1 Tax=Apiotrichum porosum TaxID=105984 RepID=A0A427XSP0_9TREE|nr:uncharacterized protein EHS24_008049 [Apiotrichum porosum]RSH81854.1 hypothetical protein EHS24_008049 [Apiotrichum porosum]